MTSAGMLFLSVLALSAVGWRIRQLRGTTLIGPCFWKGIAFLSIAAVELWNTTSSLSPEQLEAWRFAALASSFCPLIALLGAQRPQNRAWHFIVLSLWIILVLPVFESIAFQRGAPDLAGARTWFMWALVLLGVLNTLRTGQWLAAWLYSIGQGLLLGRQTGILALSPPILSGYALLVLSMLAVCGLALKKPQPRSADRLWVEFRNDFGVLWSLRVSERINAAAERYSWNLRLQWDGFTVPAPDKASFWSEPDQRAAFDQLVENLLRRFVSPQWIAERYERAAD